MNNYTILNILMTIFSLQIIKAYFTSFNYVKRKNKVFSIISWCIYLLFQYWVMVSSAVFPLLILILNIIIIYLLFKSTYIISSKTALFLSGIFYTFWMLVEIIINNILHMFFIEEPSYFFIVGSVVSKIILYTLLQVFKKYFNENSLINLPLHYWVRLFLIPIATIYIIHNTYLLTSPVGNTFFFTLTTILLVFINYISFDMYDKLGTHAEIEKRNLAYEQQLELCNKQSTERELAYQETKRIRHDLNEYLVAIKATLLTGDINTVLSKIDTLLDHNHIYKKDVSRSGNLVIDSLINYKHTLVEKEGIKMECNILVPPELPYDSADLCIIIGNLLDNALEATQSLSVESRYINLSITQIKGNLSITIENPYNGKLKKDNTLKLLSIKSDIHNHGIGLTSVKQSVDKYNGELLIKTDHNIFNVSIFLYPR